MEEIAGDGHKSAVEDNMDKSRLLIQSINILSKSPTAKNNSKDQEKDRHRTLNIILFAQKIE